MMIFGILEEHNIIYLDPMKTRTIPLQTLCVVYFLSICFSYGQADGNFTKEALEDKIGTLLKKASENNDSTLIYAKEAYALAEKEDSIHTQIKILNFIDDYHYSNQNDQAMVINLKKLLSLYEEVGDQGNMMRVYSYMCKPYRNMMKFDSLFYVFEKGMELAHELKDERSKASLNLEMGDYFSYGVQDIDKAIEYLKKALPYYKSKEDDPTGIIGLSRVYHDLGKNFMMKGEMDSIEKYSKLGIIAANKSGKESVIEILNSLRGDVLSQQNRHEESIVFVEKALKLAKKANNEEAILFNQNVLIYNYLGAEKNLDRVPELLKNSEELAIKISGTKQHILVHEYRSKYFSMVGDYKKALESYEKLVKMRDELNEHLKQQDLESLSQQFELKEKERDLVYLKSKNEDQKTINKLLISLFGLALLIGGFVWRSNRLKSELNRKELEVLKAEKLKEDSELERIKALQRMEEEKNLVLKKQLEHNERELVSTTLFITKKNEILTNIKDSIRSVSKRPEIDKNELVNITNMIDKNLDVKDDWEAFKLRFEQVHPNFFTHLKSNFPKVNANDSRLLGFIKMGMDNNEIARISGVNTASIYKARYRLRKKLELDESVDLDQFALELV